MVKKRIRETGVLGGLFGLGLGTGVGAAVVEKADTTNVGAAKGLGSFATFFPAMGTIGGAGLTLKMARKGFKRQRRDF